MTTTSFAPEANRTVTAAMLILGYALAIGFTDNFVQVIARDLDSAFRIADRIAFLYRGRIVANAPPQEFRDLPDPRVQQFIQGLATGPLTD